MTLNTKHRPLRVKRILIITAALVATVSILAFIVPRFSSGNDPWPVPAKYANMKSPLKTTPEVLATGKELWIKHCQSCHGKSGKGDGPKSAQLKTLPGDMTKENVQKQSDGALFYKSTEGRKDMPKFKKKIPDQEDMWSIVAYVRTFKK
jgi:mono/diheme cytochrome c family protein